MSRARAILWIFLLFLFLFALFLERPLAANQAYYYDILINIGINIILAVSLNLINGYTGQFSLGHAGFMAVGAYTAAMITTQFGTDLLPLLGGQTWLLFALALYVGGLAAALSGLIVGGPSLRLKGDYLAIATLGFGEII